MCNEHSQLASSRADIKAVAGQQDLLIIFYHMLLAGSCEGFAKLKLENKGWQVP